MNSPYPFAAPQQPQFDPGLPWNPQPQQQPGLVPMPSPDMPVPAPQANVQPMLAQQNMLQPPPPFVYNQPAQIQPPGPDFLQGPQFQPQAPAVPLNPMQRPQSQMNWNLPAAAGGYSQQQDALSSHTQMDEATLKQQFEQLKRYQNGGGAVLDRMAPGLAQILGAFSPGAGQAMQGFAQGAQGRAQSMQSQMQDAIGAADQRAMARGNFHDNMQRYWDPASPTNQKDALASQSNLQTSQAALQNANTSGYTAQTSRVNQMGELQHKADQLGLDTVKQYQGNALANRQQSHVEHQATQAQGNWQKTFDHTLNVWKDSITNGRALDIRKINIDAQRMMNESSNQVAHWENQAAILKQQADLARDPMTSAQYAQRARIAADMHTSHLNALMDLQKTYAQLMASAEKANDRDGAKYAREQLGKVATQSQDYLNQPADFGMQQQPQPQAQNARVQQLMQIPIEQRIQELRRRGLIQ